jgi:hypothetical protein
MLNVEWSLATVAMRLRQVCAMTAIIQQQQRK